ncbi:MAG: D-alanyl-D-alanine carboxypeptidase family protein [Phormidesmis sp.]
MTTQILQDRFEIETQLSCTDFSTVYLGCDRKYMHRPHCLITAIPYHQREIRHRLEREAQIWEQLGRHPQIPRLLAYFYKRESKTDGTFYLVQDHIEGHSLTKELSEADGTPKKLSESYVMKLLQDVLVALTFAHDQGVVHQRLHPQHLVRQERDGSIFLTGFGAMAKIARSKVVNDGTLSSSIPASPSPYVAPEQLRSLFSSNDALSNQPAPKGASAPEEGAQPASDLYALGLIAIEALTGKRHAEFEYGQTRGLQWRADTDVSLPLAEFIDRLVRQAWRDRFLNAKDALKTFQYQSDRHNIANDSRMPTVVAAPGKQPAVTTAAFSPSQRASATRTYAVSTPPYFHKFVIGSIAAVLALGIGVKTYQWGEYRVSQLPQTWQDWRQNNDIYTAADPNTLTPLLADGSMLLHPTAAQSFWQMAAAAKTDDITLYPLAGHRESEDEVLDYATGYAMDIGGADEASDRQSDFAKTPEFQWLKRNAKAYGFELANTTEPLLTGAVKEPWHWWYVGDDASQKALGL